MNEEIKIRSDFTSTFTVPKKKNRTRNKDRTQLFLRHSIPRVDLLGIIVLNAQATLSTFSIFQIPDRSCDRFSSRRQIIKRKVSIERINFFLSFFDGRVG